MPPIYIPIFPAEPTHPIVPSAEHPIYLPPNGDASPEHPIFIPIEPPLGFWGGTAPPFVDIAPPGQQPPAGAHPMPPIYLPVAPSHPIHIEVGPEHPIYIPIEPPPTESGVPSHPIYIEIKPEHPITYPPEGGGAPVYPAHPITIPEPPPIGTIPGLKPEHPIYLPPSEPAPQNFYVMVADPATHQYVAMSFVPGGKPPTTPEPKVDPRYR
jgi:hypothetical protein